MGWGGGGGGRSLGHFLQKKKKKKKKSCAAKIDAEAIFQQTKDHAQPKGENASSC